MNRLLQLRAEEVRKVLSGSKTAHFIPVNNLCMVGDVIYSVGSGLQLEANDIQKAQLAAVVSGGLEVGDIIRVIESYKEIDGQRFYFSRGEVDPKQKQGATKGMSKIPLCNALTLVQVNDIRVTSMNECTELMLNKAGIDYNRNHDSRFQDLSAQGLAAKADALMVNEAEEMAYLQQAYLYVAFDVHTLDVRDLTKSALSEIKIK